MSNEITKAANSAEGLPEHVRAMINGTGQRGLILPFALFVVDAGFLEYFTTRAPIPRVVLQRAPLTYGSVDYQLRTTQQHPIFATVRIRALDTNVTDVSLIMEGQGDSDSLRQTVGGLMRVLILFNFWLMDEVKSEAADEAREVYNAMLATDPAALGKEPQYQLPDMPIKRPRGAPPDPDNEWARQELALGRDYHNTFVAWAERRGLDHGSAKTKDLFRKQVAQTPRRK